MNNELTDITILLDASASMERLTDQTLAGLNKFIADQKALPGQCNLTLVQFADDYVKICTAMDIQEIDPITLEDYIADGPSTALVQSFCKLIRETEQRINDMPEEQKPGKVIFVAITDGEDNVKGEFTKDILKERINKAQTEKNWQFVYMGANQDAITTAEQYGIGAGQSLSYTATSAGVNSSYGSLSGLTARYRSVAGGDMAQLRCAASFTPEDRTAQATDKPADWLGAPDDEADASDDFTSTFGAAVQNAVKGRPMSGKTWSFSK